MPAASKPKFKYVKVIKGLHYVRRKLRGEDKYWRIAAEPGTAEYSREHARILAGFEVEAEEVLDDTVRS